MHEKRCFGCGKENSTDIIEKSYSTAYYFEITKLYIVLEVLQTDVKYLYFKRNILKNVFPILFSWEKQTSMFPCWHSWVVTTKTCIAVKFIKKYEKAFRKPH